MRLTAFSACALLACVLSGCSAQMLEDIGEVGPPRDCREPTKLFMNFIMHAKSVSWTAPARVRGKPHSVSIELVFENIRKWPIALSNSGGGVLYSVEYSLVGGSSGYAPTEAAGIAAGSELHRLIKPAEPMEGKLVFSVPRANYLLVIERKFAGKPVPGKREDHVSMCNILSGEISSARPAQLRGVSGTY